MKIILIDAGNFYTKVYVMHMIPGSDQGNRIEERYKFYGRCFFPTLVSEAGEMNNDRIYYENEGHFYTVGYDCVSSMRLEEVIAAFDGGGGDDGKAIMTLKKIIFDYAENNDYLEITVIVDSYQRAQIFEEIGKTLGNKKIEISAFRGYDKRNIKKEVTITLDVMSSGDAVAGFLEKNKMDLTTALVVDIGYSKTKLYIVNYDNGVEIFQIENCGVSFYYKKILNLFAEANVDNHDFLWLVKQIELGCAEVEVGTVNKRQLTGDTVSGANPLPRQFDISLVMENVRWDLNKEFKRFTSDMLSSYYTKRVEWPAMLVVTGGGAAINGDILHLSLEEEGYCFDNYYVERQPIYTMLEGAGYILSAPDAE